MIPLYTRAGLLFQFYGTGWQRHFFRLSGLVLNLKNGTFRYQVTQIWLKNHNYTFEDLEKKTFDGDLHCFLFLQLIKQGKYLNVNGRTAEVS